MGKKDDLGTLDSTRTYNQTVLGSGMCRLLDAPPITGGVYKVTHFFHLFVVDPAGNVKGMYRLLDLIVESGSNGYGKCHSLGIKPIGLHGLMPYITVDKVVIAQDSLQRFVNSLSPGAYASNAKVDFKTLDRLMIKLLGVYGSKDEIVRLLRSIGAVDENG